MTTTINASPSNGLVNSPDGSGILKVQSNGVTTNALAWVSFTGSTAAIRSSYNVSSITRASAGHYTVNMANSLSDANYAITATSSPSAGAAANPAGVIVCTDHVSIVPPTTSAFTLLQFNAGYSAYIDPVYMNVAVFGN